MHYITHCCIILLGSSIVETAHADFSIKNMFGKKGVQETVNKKYTIQPGGTFSLENLCGNIVIRPQKGTETVTLSATKRAANAEQLQPCVLPTNNNRQNV